MTQSQIVQAIGREVRGYQEGVAGVFVLPGIGRLVRVDRKARMGRNPATGEAIKIAAKKVVKFRIAKAAKEAIVPPKKAKA